MNRYLVLKEKIKLWFMVLLFNVIKKIYPGNDVNINIHNIDFRILNRAKWDIDILLGDHIRTASRKNCEGFDITLFEKEK